MVGNCEQLRALFDKGLKVKVTSKPHNLGKEVKHLLALSEKFAVVYNEMVGGAVTMDLMEHFLLGSSESLGYSAKDYELALQVLNNVNTGGLLESTYQMLVMTFCQFLYNVGFVISYNASTNEVNVIVYSNKKSGLKIAHAVHNAYTDTLNNAMSMGVDMYVIEEFKKQFGACKAPGHTEMKGDPCFRQEKVWVFDC